MKLKYNLFAAVVALAVVFTACSSNPKVTRGTIDDQKDLSGYWNAKDVKIVCDDLIDQCLKSPKVAAAYAKANRPLRVMVGSFRNRSDEHIDTSIISSVMRVSLNNSGVFVFVEGGDTREELRAERQDQQTNASEATAAALGNETGADYLLVGTVMSSVDKAGNTMSRSYVVTADLSDVETTEIVWSGLNTSINKTIVTPKAKP